LLLSQRFGFLRSLLRQFTRGLFIFDDAELKAGKSFEDQRTGVAGRDLNCSATIERVG